MVRDAIAVHCPPEWLALSAPKGHRHVAGGFSRREEGTPEAIARPEGELAGQHDPVAPASLRDAISRPVSRLPWLKPRETGHRPFGTYALGVTGSRIREDSADPLLVARSGAPPGLAAPAQCVRSLETSATFGVCRSWFECAVNSAGEAPRQGNSRTSSPGGPQFCS